jgi:hypothetical protein
MLYDSIGLSSSAGDEMPDSLHLDASIPQGYATDKSQKKTPR